MNSTKTETNDSNVKAIIENYYKLTPENKEKFWKKYYELLAEQEAEK